MSERRQTSGDKIKIAIKEALDDKRMEDLAKQNQEILTKVAEGFSAVHTRQDAANGKLLNHEIRFEKLDTETKSRSNYDKLSWLLLTTLIGMVVFFITRG